MRRNCSLWFHKMEAVARDVLLVQTHLFSRTFHFSRFTGDGENATLWREFFLIHPLQNAISASVTCVKVFQSFSWVSLMNFRETQFFFAYSLHKQTSILLSFCLCSEDSWVALLYELSWGLDWACHLVQLADVTGVMLLLTGRQASAGAGGLEVSWRLQN